MKFQETYDFDYDSDTILRMFTDRDYYIKKYERLGGSHPDIVDCNEDAERFTVTIRHSLDASKLNFPDFIKRQIGDRLRLRQVDSWQVSTQKGRIVIDMEKIPASITIDMDLTDDGGKAHLTLDFDIKVAIPLIGGRAEKAIAGPMTRHMRKDLAVSNKLAAGYAA